MARNFGLDTPRETRRSLRGNIDPETFGRLSERFARFLGTARFLVYMTAFVVSWVLWNTLAPADIRFDKYQIISRQNVVEFIKPKVQLNMFEPKQLTINIF